MNGTVVLTVFPQGRPCNHVIYHPIWTFLRMKGGAMLIAQGTQVKTRTVCRKPGCIVTQQS